MKDMHIIESITGVQPDGRKSRLPAKLDYIQSITGLFLATFMVGHMIFVSSILISKEFMNSVAKFMEMPAIFGDSPIAVTFAAGFVFLIFIIHAGVALRKFPGTYRQYRVSLTHAHLMNHTDTRIWFIQVFTGFAMFFLGSVHLYVIMTHPEITADISADRMATEWMAPLYLLLLLAVEFHGAIGLYRLALKWGWFLGDNPKEGRKKLKVYKHALTVFMLVLGILSLLSFIKIGLENRALESEKIPHTSSLEVMQKAVLS
ncbi:MAG: fumarate reductase cytochrome b subunit [Epsilonproteobacteria bacterium]|nr:fumarate reductase cytochrome b subunit [Campylobacterota bacterium]